MSQGAKITFLRLRRGRKGQKSLFCGFGGVARGKNHFSAASEVSQGAKITFLWLRRGREGQKSLFCGFGGVARGKNLFSEGPLNSPRDYFDVYAVTAVSLNEEFGRGYETALGCALEGGSSTGISGDEETVFSYVKCVEGVDEEDVLAVVILNTPTYAGTTYYGYYSSSSGMAECAIAYCPVVGGLDNELFRQVLVHEAVGHGFGKLMDEYSYESNGTIPASEKAQVQYLQTLSWARNVDFTPKETDVLWASFLTDERYASQGLGVFEGACTYVSGAYRPSEESMMNSNTLGFNAPSRQAIYDMVMRRALGKEPTYEEFVEFDQRTFSSTVQGQVRSSSAVSSVGRLACLVLSVDL